MFKVKKVLQLDYINVTKHITHTIIFHYILLQHQCIFSIFTARRYASAVYAMVVCLSICLSVCLCLSVSVCPSQVGVLLKWLNIGKRKQRHTIAQ